MAVIPGEYNFSLHRRADHNVTLQFKDASDTAIDLTGWTVAAQAWDRPRANKYADFSIAYTDRVNGTVTLGLSSVDTALFPNELLYDVLLTDPQGFKEYYLEGIITALEGYTA